MFVPVLIMIAMLFVITVLLAIADKLLVSTALIMLLSVGRIPTWAVWMVVVIVGRELAVTGLRGIASAGGLVVALGSVADRVDEMAEDVLKLRVGLDRHGVAVSRGS